MYIIGRLSRFLKFGKNEIMSRFSVLRFHLMSGVCVECLNGGI